MFKSDGIFSRFMNCLFDNPLCGYPMDCVLPAGAYSGGISDALGGACDSGRVSVCVVFSDGMDIA